VPYHLATPQFPTPLHWIESGPVNHGESVARRFWFSILLLAVFATACPGKRPDPEEVLRTFLSDLRNHRVDAAWAALSESTQKELMSRHQKLVEAGVEKNEATPMQLLRELGLTMLNKDETISVVSPIGLEVDLQVTVKDGRIAKVHMVQEGHRWKVDLMRSLEPAKPLEDGLGAVQETETSTD
jgi:hypothetical protein